MKSILFSILTLIPLFGPRIALAGPYFRAIDLGDYRSLKPNTGALVDPTGKGANDAVGMLPLFSHSTEDGCLLPTIVCEDWSPLALGVGGNLRSDPYLAVGPSINILPVAKGVALASLNAATKAGDFASLKNSLKPAPKSSVDLAVAVGPTWVVKPSENWKGYFRLFFGGAWSFGRKA